MWGAQWACAAALTVLLAAGTGADPSTKGGWWRPTQNLPFQYQLIEKLDPDRHYMPDVQVYVVDGFDATADAVSALKAKGNGTHPVYPVCYFSAGTREDWRPDADLFLEVDKGDELPDWPGERWVDTSSDNVRRIMRARMQMCADKGFLAVDPDNVDAYSHPNGLGLTAADQLDYNAWLARTAHDLGLGVGLKNDIEQVPQLWPQFDFFVNEVCHEYNECFPAYNAPIAAGKPVWNVEYKPEPFKSACANTSSGIQTIFKKINLDPCRKDCSSPVLDCPDAGANNRSSKAIAGRAAAAAAAAAAASVPGGTAPGAVALAQAEAATNGSRSGAAASGAAWALHAAAAFAAWQAAQLLPGGGLGFV